ncbi:hypothetical protein K439DRAFT_1628058 [Ramaria rubella]|nr:hypothetical protein K439DRAFT_1628058 [Ramaria rubella]
MAILVRINSAALCLGGVHRVEGVRLAALARGLDAEYLLLACAPPCPDRGPEDACTKECWSGSVKA